MQADSLPAEPQGQPKNAGLGSLFLLQWIFPTQELIQGLLHCWWILCQLSYQGSPFLILRNLYLYSYFGCITSSLWCSGFSLMVCGLYLVAHGLSGPTACGILVPLPGTEPTSPALEGDSQPLDRREVPRSWQFRDQSCHLSEPPLAPL